MTYLPRITRLDVSGYEMFPGTPDEPGLHREFAPGMTLIVGANGLGKTTLVTLLRHMCAGPQRLSNRAVGTFDAGRLRTTAAEVETFADRVGDRASSASACISMDIANRSVRATRSLRNLSLTALVIDGAEVEASEERFCTAVVAAAQVTDYADWLLLVDHLIFVTEDRSLPFWDRNVQRQLLRILTHDAAAARALSDAESQHISADSEFRNARAQLTRHRSRFETLAAKVAGSGDINDALATLSVEREQVARQIDELQNKLDLAMERHREAVRDHEVAEVEHQQALDTLEVARFELIESALPTQDDVVRYLRSRIATEQTCPICGQEGGEVADHLEGSSCFLCRLPIDEQPSRPRPALVALETQVAHAVKAVEGNSERAEERAAVVRQLQADLAAWQSSRVNIDGRMKALRSRLPRGGADLGSNAALIADLEDDLESLRVDLGASRAHLEELIELSNEAVRGQQDEIKRVFDDVATRFLVERCQLVPHTTPVRIGQEGERFQVQAFDLDLASATEVGESRRDTADDVSESQRVFIDVAFRIALIHTSVAESSGTMVIDAPEGSLDAVFSTNAATLLAAFIAPEFGENRLIVASNLVEGSLLPALARVAAVRQHNDSRLIDLLQVAAPTAAVLQRGDEYRAVLEKALAIRAAEEAP